MISPMRSSVRAGSIASNSAPRACSGKVCSGFPCDKREAFARRSCANKRQAMSKRSAELLERAGWALKTNHPGEAERLAAEVLKAERGNTAAASLLGQALLTQHRASEAIAPLEKAVKRS